MTDAIKQIEENIQRHQRFLISSHINPDGDAIGSCLALAIALEAMGKDVVVYNLHGVPYQFTFLPMAQKVVTKIDKTDKFDVAFVLDCAELERVGSGFADMVSTKMWINIDHHLTNDRFADLSLIDKNACATGYLVYQLIKTLPTPVNLEIAENIYTTILIDTGCFKYSNASPEAFTTAAEMVQLGVSPWKIASYVYESQPQGRIKLLNMVLNTLEIADSGKVASVAVTSQMMRSTNTGPESTDGFVNYPRSISGVEVAFLIREIGVNRYKVSFRSKGKVNVAAISQSFGGGGHKNAAGCVMEGEIPDIRKRMTDAVTRNL